MISPELGSLFGQLDSSLRAVPSSVLTKDCPLYIYGAGHIGKEICTLLKDRNLSVTAFLDRKAQPESTWEGIDILPPNTDKLSLEQRKDAQVILGVFNRDADVGAITSLLYFLGYGRVVSFLEFHHEFHAELGNRFWLTHRRFYLAHQQEIVHADQLWSDDASRHLYRSLLKFRFTLRYEELSAVSLDDQYFPADLPPWPSPLRLADCGAYDGDTLRYLAASPRPIPIEAVAAFEPDLANYHKLADFFRSKILNVPGPVCLFPCGVGSATANIRFSGGQGESSSISDSGDEVITCVTLDSALVGFRPNLIKMDIEGSELDALIGARQILSENRPGLAICVYHRPDHLWTIPLMIHRQLPGGRHYLRAHGHNGLELVYYWLP